MNVRAESKRTHSKASEPSPVGPSRARRDGSGRNGSTGFATANDPDLLPATARSYVADSDRLAARVAANCVDQLDELSLIGYASLDPATRAVYAETIRMVARGVLES